MNVFPQNTGLEMLAPKICKTLYKLNFSQFMRKASNIQFVLLKLFLKYFFFGGTIEKKNSFLFTLPLQDNLILPSCNYSTEQNF